MTARKSQDAETLSILQVALAALKNEKIKKGGVLEDVEVEAQLARLVKQLQDALQDFEKASRKDLIQKTEKEISILKAYLPEQLSDDELRDIVRAVVGKGSFKSSGDLGKAIGAVMPEVKGRADGARVKKMVSELMNAPATS